MMSETTTPAPEAAPAPGSGPEPETTARHESRQAIWLRQLQAMIDELSTQATPALREVAAKAAELAAKAGEAAGPIAHRAAEVTGEVGQKVAEKGREVAADLRRASEVTQEAKAQATPPAPEAPTEQPVEVHA